MVDNEQAKKVIFDAKQTVVDHLERVISETSFRYETFGKEIEDFVTDQLIEILINNGTIHDENDYRKAENKNQFPELSILSKPPIAIEVKSGNHIKKQGCKWSQCNNSQNDMGTLNQWPKKLEEYEGDNIIYVFIEYLMNDEEKRLIDVKIDYFYKFLDINTEGVLKYREKDGNLRPKNFDATSTITSYQQFQLLFEPTVRYRAKRLVKKHLKDLPPEDRAEIIRDLADKNDH